MFGTKTEIYIKKKEEEKKETPYSSTNVSDNGTRCQ
jgi:hypothetical protein